jgi:hypothetical protein
MTPTNDAETEGPVVTMPQRDILDRLIQVAEFVLQAPLPESTRQLLATTLDALGPPAFTDWLETWDLLSAEPNVDKRIVFREQTQEVWVNSMRQLPGPLPAALVSIYDAANAPIAQGFPPLTAEAADAVLDIFAFQSAVVHGVEMPIAPQQRAAWRAHLASQYPMLNPSIQQVIAAAPLAGPMMRAQWSDLGTFQQGMVRQQWAMELPQLTMFVNAVMQGGGMPPAAAQPPAWWGQRGPQAAHQPPGNDQEAIRQLQQLRRNDQMVVNALNTGVGAVNHAMMNTANHLRS